MNKIVLNTEKSLNGNIQTLEIDGNVSYFIEGNTIIDNMSIKDNFEVNFYLKENTSLIFGNVLELKNKKGKICFYSSNNTELVFHLGIHSLEKNELYIENIISGNNNKSEIRIRVISEENASIFLKTIGTLEENTLDNEFLEDVKYLNEYPGSIICLPELFVSSNEVIANHNMTVSNIDEESLFYLESKGIEKEVSKKMIRENFIKCMIRKEDKDEY